MDMTKMKLFEKSGGRYSRPFMIAEAGINHNGQLEKAYSMIKIAKTVGADSVKFQTFKSDEFIGDPNMMFTYKSQNKVVTEPMIEMFKRYEFNRDEWFLIKRKCDEEGILFLSTPQNRSDLDLLLEIGITAIKVGSDDFTNLPLLKSYSSTGLPMIVSCGMSDMADVYKALEAIGSLDGYPTVLMLCTSEYPTPPEDVNLLKLKTLGKAFPDLMLGFSDHTQGVLASSLAVALGAVVFEKHFTIDQGLAGPDHWFSESPEGLKEWVVSVNNAYAMMGSQTIRPTEKEKAMIKLARRCIVTISDISENEVLSQNNVGLKRVGDGLPAEYFYNLLGLRSTRKLSRNSVLKWGDFK
jgi:N,N'-diacetyllegionaminate synthase